MGSKETELYLIVKGRVQGVNFRSNAKRIADSIGIKGWVRNEIDGSVSLVCQGGEGKLMEFIEAIGEGPGLSNITEIVRKKREMKEKHENFKIIKEGGFFSDQRQSFKNLGKGLLDFS